MCTTCFFSDHAPDIIIGISGGLSAGIGLWGIERLREMWLFDRHEKRILKFFEDNKNKEWKFYNTFRIASEVNLTLDRVNFVSSYSKKITRNQLGKETWKLFMS